MQELIPVLAKPADRHKNATRLLRIHQAKTVLTHTALPKLRLEQHLKVQC